MFSALHLEGIKPVDSNSSHPAPPSGATACAAAGTVRGRRAGRAGVSQVVQQWQERLDHLLKCFHFLLDRTAESGAGEAE